MKRVVNIVRCLMIAVYPVTFVFGISSLDTYINEIMSRTYHYSYIWWIIISYGISGVIFAVIGICRKENLRRKEILIAYIAAGVLAVLVSLILLLDWKGVVPFSVPFGRTIFNTNIYLLSFALGFTIYNAIKAVIFTKDRVS